MSRISDVIYGKCPICGDAARDYPAASLTSADAQDNIDGADSSLTDPSKGVPLEWWRGELMCRTCKNRLQADDESLIAAERHAESQSFRDKAGFVREVE